MMEMVQTGQEGAEKQEAVETHGGGCDVARVAWIVARQAPTARAAVAACSMCCRSARGLSAAVEVFGAWVLQYKHQRQVSVHPGSPGVIERHPAYSSFTTLS